MESLQYDDNCFLTLTYSEDNVPELGSLDPNHLRLFLYRLRKSFRPARLRFFAVGEYGDLSQRPHYHVALFGYPTCDYGLSRYSKVRTSCCAVCDHVQSTWGLGNVILGTLEQHSAQYVAGYVVKKLTKKDDTRLGDRHPEFARMSNRPGIGYSALHEVASEILHYGLVDNPDVDVPTALRHGSNLLPLGRYLQTKLRLLVGRDALTPAAALEKITEEVRTVFAATEGAPRGTREFIFKDLVCRLSEPEVMRIEARSRIYKKRGSI